MSKQETAPTTPQPLTPEQQYQQMFSKLSVQFKTPLRNILGEAEEAVQNTVSNLIQQLIQINMALKYTNEEVIRLRKLCADNNIRSDLRPQNRAECRAKERKHDKEISSKIKK